MQSFFNVIATRGKYTSSTFTLRWGNWKLADLKILLLFFVYKLIENTIFRLSPILYTRIILCIRFIKIIKC